MSHDLRFATTVSRKSCLSFILSLSLAFARFFFCLFIPSYTTVLDRENERETKAVNVLPIYYVQYHLIPNPIINHPSSIIQRMPGYDVL